ncbi:unnamed protein product [Penicillium pancosmium]
MPRPATTAAGGRFDAPAAYLALRVNGIGKETIATILLRRHRGVSDLSSKVHRYETILGKLFPNNVNLEALVDLSADDLMELIIGSKDALVSELLDSESEYLSPSQSSKLDILEYVPEEEADQNQLEEPQVIVNVSDDVNALSALTKSPSTFQGISSIYAALKAILRVDARALHAPEHLSNTLQRTKWNVKSFEGASLAYNPNFCFPVQSSKALAISGPELLDAYFANFHPFAPLFDETSFRKTYCSLSRTDARWMGLLNTVFALGSIAASNPQDLSHFTYYRRAMSHVNLASLGATNIETIQTLALTGGFYLHYINQPNLAHSVLGAALRMAASLGLYKDFTLTPGRASTEPSLELNRRVWWSIFCLDTWACMPLGRPPFGRMGEAVTVQLPRGGLGNETTDFILPFVESIGFCKVATKIQESLAISPLIPHSDLKALDTLLLQWYDEMNPLLKSDEASEYAVAITRPVIRWRFQIQRMLLYRPVLLNYALGNNSYEDLSFEDRNAIETCRAVADELIRDISRCSIMNSVVCANAVWYIFQAAMTPLLGLFIIGTAPDSSASRFESWRLQVQMTLDTLLRMQQWSLSALQAWELLSRFLSAGLSHFEKNNENNHDLGGQMEEEISVSAAAEGFSTGYDQIANENSATCEYFWDFVSQTDMGVLFEIGDFGFENTFSSLSGLEDSEQTIYAFDSGAVK